MLKATYLGRAIREYENGMHVDLNDYFPSSNLPRLYRTRNGPDDDRLSLVAAAVALTACERAKKQPGTDIWLTATLLGAAFDGGKLSEAQRLARELRLQGLAPWQLKTMLLDLELSIALQSESDAAALRAVLADLERLAGASASPAGVGTSSS